MFKNAFKITFGIVFGLLFAAGFGLLVDSAIVWVADKMLRTDADFREWKERKYGRTDSGVD